VVVELRWVLGHSSWVWDSPVRQLASRQSSQMQTRARCGLEINDGLLPSVPHSYKIQVMLLEKMWQNLFPGRIGGISQIY